MTPLEIGYFGVLALIILIIIRVPVAIALILPSLVGVWAIIGTNASWGLLRSTPYEIGGNWSLSSIPMFLMMGYICYHSRLTDGLFKAARCWLSALPGGLGISTIAGAAVFSAVSGSTTACAAAMGRIAVPEMLREKYHPGFAASICAVGGTLGSMIPPSIVMIIYGTFAEVPIGKLFIAGVIPGILSAIVFSLVIIAVAWLRPDICPPGKNRSGWAERISSLGETWPVMVLIVGVLGGIFAGIFSATEAGAVGAFFSLVIAALRRKLTLSILATALLETARMTATILIIAIGAALFTRFLALSGVATHLSELAILYATSPIVLVLGVAAVYLVLGMFLDPLGIMLLTLPLLLPAFNALDINLIWMGILVVKFLEIGLITPPVGLNLFVMQAIVGREASIDKIARFLVWFILADLCTMALLISFPAIVTFLPALLG